MNDVQKPTDPSPSESGLYFPWWAVVGLVAVVGLLSCGIWGAVYGLGGDVPPGGRTPEIVVLTATPTPAAPTVETTDTAPAQTPLPEPSPTDTLPPSDIAIGLGVRVEIVGTGAAGLSLREGAGTNYERLGVAYDGEFFTVEEGPQPGGGYEWWYIVNVDDPNQAGWAVRQYMQVIEAAAPEADGE